MRPATMQAIDPVGRFKDIYREIDAKSAWWSDSAWLRFAAHAAVMRPADPAETTRAIRAAAEDLQAHFCWYEAMASSVNLVVATTLVQIGDTADVFRAELASAHQLLQKVGFRHGGMHEILAILALRVLSGGKPISESTAQRLQRIYRQMRTHHLWLTGGEDLPSCAVLTACAGTPEQVAGVAEGAYAALRDARFPPGNDLQAAANVLPATGLSAGAASERFRKLFDSFRAHRRTPGREDYEAVAMLSLLDHEPERIAARHISIFDDLQRLKPRLFDEVNINIAADLTFLELSRYDGKMRLLTEHEEVERMHALSRLQRAVSLCLVKVPPTPIMPDQIS